MLTLWEGNIHLRTPMLFAIGFIFTFIHGGLTGLFLGNVTIDLPLSDTYFVVAHFHMVMGVSPILVVFGAIYHWWPKITGKMYNETLGKWHFWMTFLGTYAIYLPMHYLGFAGVPRRYFAMGNTDFLPDSAQDLNACDYHLCVVRCGNADFVLHERMIWSLKSGPKVRPESLGRDDTRMANTGPRRRNTATGGTTCPSVIVGHTITAVPGYDDDYIPQNVPADKAPAGRDHGVTALSGRSRLIFPGGNSRHA